MRWVIALFAFVLAGLQIELWFGDDRLPRLRELEHSVAAQSAINQALGERNADLKAEISSLNLGNEAAEERARSQLGLVLPDESFYQVVR
jgi:cell division protein FtsB